MLSKIHSANQDLDLLTMEKLRRIRGKQLEENDADTEEEPLPGKASFKGTLLSFHKAGPRLNLTSDYDSNESPSGSELTIDDSQLHLEASPKPRFADKCFYLTKSDSVCEETCCSHCGAKLSKSRVKKTSLRWPFVDLPPPLVPQLNQKGHHIIDNTTYDLESIRSNPLLNRINEWDYPIFELADQLGDTVLSQMAYYIFVETGIMEAFRIPTTEFLL